MVGPLRIAGLALLLLPVLSLAAPRLLLTLDKTETELGRPLQAELIGVDLRQRLDEIDLRPLEDDFDVVRVESEDKLADPRWPGSEVQRIRLTLYPRRHGGLTIPVLERDGLHSRAQTIHVAEGGSGGRPITFRPHVSADRAWEREQILITVEITTPDLFASLDHVTAVKIPGFEVVPLPATREQKLSAGEKYAQLRTGWALFPLVPGAHRVALPPLLYRLHGRVERRYFLPKLALEVRALPPYVPPTLPVGKVTIHSTPPPGPLLHTDTLTDWDLTLDGAGLLPHWLPPVLRQIESTDQIHFLPPSSRQDMRPAPDGVHGRVTHRIPLKALSSGPLSLPDLGIQYFDPRSGRLVSMNHHPQRPFVLSGAWRVLGGGLLALLALWLIRRLYRVGQAARGRRRQRRAALTHLARAHDAWELRAALTALARAEGWPGNLSLRDWARRWRAAHRRGPDLDEAIAALSRACYGRQAPAISPALRDRLVSRITRRWP